MPADPPNRLLGDDPARRLGCPHLQRDRPPSGPGAIAQRSHASDQEIERALEEGFRQGVAQAMSNGILNRDEEERLRAFRDRLALEDSAADSKPLATLDRASSTITCGFRPGAMLTVSHQPHHLESADASRASRRPFLMIGWSSRPGRARGT